MAGLVPAIHVFLDAAPKTWMPGTSPGMTAPFGAPAILLRRLEDRDIVGDRGAAHIKDAAEFWVRKLHALGRLPRKLHRGHHMHGDAGRADRVAFGLQSAGRIDR